MTKVVDILVRRLLAKDPIAEKAAEALQEQADCNGNQMAQYVPALVPYLTSSNFNVRAAISRALGGIGTEEAIEALQAAVLISSEKELATECGYSRWSEEPFYYWLLSGIAKRRKTANAQALIDILASQRVSRIVKSGAMQQLAHFKKDDIGISLPHDFIDMLEEFASSEDEDIASGAIDMLGRVNAWGLRMDKTSQSSFTEASNEDAQRSAEITRKEVEVARMKLDSLYLLDNDTPQISEHKSERKAFIANRPYKIERLFHQSWLVSLKINPGLSELSPHERQELLDWAEVEDSKSDSWIGSVFYIPNGMSISDAYTPSVQQEERNKEEKKEAKKKKLKKKMKRLNLKKFSPLRIEVTGSKGLLARVGLLP